MALAALAFAVIEILRSQTEHREQSKKLERIINTSNATLEDVRKTLGNTNSILGHTAELFQEMTRGKSLKDSAEIAKSEEKQTTIVKKILALAYNIQPVAGVKFKDTVKATLETKAKQEEHNKADNQNVE